MSTLDQELTQYDDPNYKPVYQGGSQPTFVEKGATEPPDEEEVFDDYGRVLFEG